MKKILLSISTIAFVGVVAAGMTGAFFSDTETSTGNTFTAGSIDLKVDNETHYDGMICAPDPETGGYVWQEETEGSSTYPQLVGQPCDASWGMTDLGPSTPLFNFTDIKPGDNGEDTLSLHVANNDAYACAVIDNVHNDENTVLAPEIAAGDNASSTEGELAQHLQFKVWDDTNGNNVQDEGEQTLTTGTAASLLPDGKSFELNGPNGATTTPLVASSTRYLGVSWCFGSWNQDTGACDGSQETNITQTDSLTADIAFYVEQARNNDSFQCPTPGANRPKVGADLAAYQAPSRDSCDEVVTQTGGSYNTIQSAIDAANPGDTICVDTGNYNEFNVDKGVTILGLNDPSGGSAAVVSPSSGPVTELALVTASDSTISGLKFDGTEATMTGSQAAGVQVSPNGADINNVHITYNVIDNLDTSGTGTHSNKGIQYWTDTAYALTNSAFTNNTIDNITAQNSGAYGVQTVGAMNNVNIGQNTISNITGHWGAGIALDGKNPVATTNVTVDHNQVMDGVNADASHYAVQVEANVDGAGIMVNNNNIQQLLYGGSSGTPSPATLNAEHNWWGDTDPSNDVFTAPGTNVVDYTPYETSAFPTY